MSEAERPPRPSSAPPAGKARQREERLGQALRANLGKRKAQSRAREAGAPVAAANDDSEPVG